MEENVLQLIVSALDDSPDLWERVRKLDKGSGTYSEASEIAEIVGDEVAKQLAEIYTPEQLDAYVRAAHELVSMVSEVAQQNLNDAARVGIKPLKTKYPKAKVKTLAEELASISEDALPEEVKNALPSFVMGMVDDIVKYNADFQAKAGLKPVIVRTWSGSYPSHDTKHTDWCQELAGTYEYGHEPNRVYARHKGCRCKVEYFPDKRAKGRITALSKGEIDRSGVLWNTRSDTLEARIRKLNRSK
jgi:hypothetical protein